MSSTELLDQLLTRLSTALPTEEVEKLRALAAAEMATLRWIPNPGAQALARDLLADQLLFGGKAGGGKSDILIGLGCTQHKRSLLLRRLNREVHFLLDRTEEILGHSKGLNAQLGRWYLPDDRLMIFGGCQHAGDERGYKGEPKDLIGLDEASEFLESQVDFLTGWLRSKDPAQRVRLVLATNPPSTAAGEWIVRWFAPWLDPQHPLFPYPAGALLYFERLPDGALRWSEEPFEIALPNGKTARALSRTFIPAELEDNPDYAKTDYAARLAALPEELRRRYERGDFTAGTDDDEFQVIPTGWIRQAQERWTKQPPPGAIMSALGVDVAQGGKDKTVFAPKYETRDLIWFDELKIWAGIDTKDGPAIAGRVVQHIRDAAQVNIDLGGGWGGSAYDHLKATEISVLGVVPSEGSSARTADGRLGFKNKRAEITWGFREALDPNAKVKIALPPSPTLRADLASYRWKLVAGGIIQIEMKEDIKSRLLRSPDEGDAVILANASGASRVQPRRSEHFNQQTHAITTTRPLTRGQSRPLSTRWTR